MTIDVELDNDVAIKLPEACPLHKHKVNFSGHTSQYLKHRVSTDDATSDGQAYASWDYSVPEDKIIDRVINGSCTDHYGDVIIKSDIVEDLESHDVTVRVILRDPDWVFDYMEGPYCNIEKTIPYGRYYWASTGKNGPNYYFATYYRDSQYTGVMKWEWEPDLYRTVDIPENPYNVPRQVTIMFDEYAYIVTQKANTDGISSEGENIDIVI